MPILIEPPPESPLSQGDLLKGIDLFVTSRDGNCAGSDPLLLKDVPMALVLSRPCALEHKARIVVAAVLKSTADLGGFATLSDGRDALARLRDGQVAAFKDAFYLGHLPGGDRTRYLARLDSLHTIDLPRDNLPDFLKERRIACLC